MNKHEYTGERPFWYDGKMVNEVGFCEDFMQKHPMVRVGGSFLPGRDASTMKKASVKLSTRCSALISAVALQSGCLRFWKC